jgi:hypothetical protein
VDFLTKPYRLYALGVEEMLQPHLHQIASNNQVEWLALWFVSAAEIKEHCLGLPVAMELTAMRAAVVVIPVLTNVGKDR